MEAVKTLPKLRPFDGVDTDAIRETTVSLFTEEVGQAICTYFAAKARLSLLPQEEISAGTAQRMTGDFSETEQKIDAIRSILRFFDTLADRLDFDSYYDLILTDFFEGLHFGHYPRKCEICGRYFLMQSARRQKYCSYGIAPEPYRGKSISCRKYDAVLNRKEKAKSDPVNAIYDLRCAAIRTECGRGTIPKDFAEAAKRLAKEHKLRALSDDRCAKEQYEKDMSRAALYAETDGKLK